MAVIAIVPIRRRTELQKMENISLRMRLTIMILYRSGARDAWDLSGEGVTYMAGARGEHLDAVSFGRIFLLRMVGIAISNSFWHLNYGLRPFLGEQRWSRSHFPKEEVSWAARGGQ